MADAGRQLGSFASAFADANPDACVALDADDWYALSALGEFRRLVNEKTRSYASDRGSHNADNDLGGVVGEGVVLKALSRIPDTVVRSDLFDARGPVDAPDWTAERRRRVTGDAKCALLWGSRCLVLVGTNAHRNSLRRGTDCYVSTVGTIGGPALAVTCPFSIHALEQPPFRTQPAYRTDDGYRQERHSAHVDEVFRHYGVPGTDWTRRRVLTELAPVPENVEAIRAARADARALLAALPPGWEPRQDASFEEIVAELVDLRRLVRSGFAEAATPGGFAAAS